MRLVLLLCLVGCHVNPSAAPADTDAQIPPPLGTLTMTQPENLVQGYDATFTIDGTLGYGETVYLLGSRGAPGAGPCPAALGNQCLDTTAPRIVARATYTGAPLEIPVPMPTLLPVGAPMTFQAAVLRGRAGLDSLISASVTDALQAEYIGCTDDYADNHDPLANVDDGTCTFTGIRCDTVDAIITAAADVARYQDCFTLRSLTIDSASGVPTISLPNLQAIHASLNVANNSDLFSLSFPRLAAIRGYANITGNLALFSLDTPSLTEVDDYVFVVGNTNLRIWSAGNLSYIGTYSYISGNTNLCAEAVAPWSQISVDSAYVADNLLCAP